MSAANEKVAEGIEWAVALVARPIRAYMRFLYGIDALAMVVSLVAVFVISLLGGMVWAIGAWWVFGAFVFIPLYMIAWDPTILDGKEVEKS